MAKKHPRWQLAKKILTVLFFIAVVVLLVVYARKVNWEDVYDVIVNYNRFVVLTAAGLVVLSYLVYGCYDLIGRAYCGHKLAKRQVMLVSFICYAFNLTLSTWVGGVAQMAVSSLNWMAMGAIIWLLLGRDVGYPMVLGVLLISSIAGVIIHIPAGIGVLEAVFLALLSGQHASHGTIIAALLAYRVLYFILPLLLALVLYLVLESRAKHLRQKNEQKLQKSS